MWFGRRRHVESFVRTIVRECAPIRSKSAHQAAAPSAAECPGGVGLGGGSDVRAGLIKGVYLWMGDSIDWVEVGDEVGFDVEPTRVGNLGSVELIGFGAGPATNAPRRVTRPRFALLRWSRNQTLYRGARRLHTGRRPRRTPCALVSRSSV